LFLMGVQVPFLARIDSKGSCDWNSIHDPPL
jgi:hypothetical protein